MAGVIDLDSTKGNLDCSTMEARKSISGIQEIT